VKPALILVLLAACACARPAAERVASPETSATPPAEQTAPQQAPGEPKVEPASVPAPPPECAAYAERKPPASTCPSDDAAALKALDAALAVDGAPRDEKLAALELCDAFAPGLVGALRADLAPRACADAVAEAVILRSGQRATPEVRSALAGLALGAKLSRLVGEAPRLAPPFDKLAFQQFMKATLQPWMAGQAQAVYLLALQGAKLSGYGKAVAAVESGLADMRFVEVVRDVPLPEDMAKDKDVRDVYYGSLDEALEPRKARGRDAALAGLRLFAEEGVLVDARVAMARKLLSTLYAGRRIDALDGLLLPALPPFAPANENERIASRLPTFYAGFVLQRADPTNPKLLRALLERGIPRPMRAHLDSGKLAAPARSLYARALVELGKLYWRSHDFERAQVVEPEAELVAALAAALQGGPKDAAEMMLRGPFLPRGVGDVKRLDDLAARRGALAGLAAYDAAHVLALVPPAEKDPKFFDELARRFRAAEKLLKDPKQRALARERADAAEQTAKAIRG
jgi:hypothetical protein